MSYWKTGQTVGLRRFVLDSKGNKIAKIESFGNDGYKHGELIAAAPEMLKALELLLYRLEVCQADLNESGEASFDAETEIRACKKAIAKAKGES